MLLMKGDLYLLHKLSSMLLASALLWLQPSLSQHMLREDSRNCKGRRRCCCDSLSCMKQLLYYFMLIALLGEVLFIKQLHPGEGLTVKCIITGRNG